MPASIELRVVITNGSPHCDVHLKFEFNQDTVGSARVWLVKLPHIKNADAFPRQISARQWELRLQATDDTQPLRIDSYVPWSASQWLADVLHPPLSAPTELLIFAKAGLFGIHIHQFHPPHEK